MSHYIKVQTKYRDAAALVESLRAQFEGATIEQFDKPTSIVGYQGRAGHACTIVVRQKTARGERRLNFGDLGFALEADGTYSQHADDSDEAGGAFAGLTQRYARTVAVKQARLSGFTVTEQQQADGTITLNLSKWS